MEVDWIGVGLHLVIILMGSTCIFLSNEVYAYFRKTSLGTPLKIIGAAFGWFLLFETLNAFQAAGVLKLIDGVVPGFSFLLVSSEILFAAMLLYGVYRFKKSFNKFDWLGEIRQA